MVDNLSDRIVEQAIELARQWQDRANALMTAEEKEIQEKMRRLLTYPRDKVILTQLIDQSFRSRDPARVADQVNSILRTYGMPEFFDEKDKLLTHAFLTLGRHLPGFSVPRIIEKMRKDSSRAIIAGEAEILFSHLARRRNEGVQVNINHLGEAVLGEEEASLRLSVYLTDLKDPRIEHISIKISTIYSQIQPLAFDATVDTLYDRLCQIYRTAQENLFVRRDGSRVPKFVTLDMEEYRDVEITVAAFRKTLDLPEFFTHSAGIALQAYLPDSFRIQRELTTWARHRVASGGSPIKIRIVKGANLEMEKVESALTNWPLAPYDHKRDVDANYKRMVAFGMQPESIKAVRLGIASHNLFDQALAFKLAEKNEVTDFFMFEMLEGMANHVRRALSALSQPVLLYAPVAAQKEFVNAIAYLIRRLDENTSADNFLRYAALLKTDSPEWSRLADQFHEACRHVARVSDRPHRTQNRNTEVFANDRGTLHQGEFRNEPDTDWSLCANRKWAEGIRKRWKKSISDPAIVIPLVVADGEIFGQRETRSILDPSQLPQEICVARFALAQEIDIDKAAKTAKADSDGWRKLDFGQRREILSQVARQLRSARDDLIGAAVAGTGKIVSEADGEVSEAVDFAEYYPYSARRFMQMGHVAARAKGVGVVVSPWNFPVAIPCGGILASLSAGNTVIFKPSSDAVLPAWILCQAFWKAGVSRNTLQFLPCAGPLAGQHLICHQDVDYVILTGGTATGLAMLKQKPDLFLSAETGGKNATIVTALSDRDQAIKNVITSAFSNSGQKCSATSLLILEKEVYEDPDFKRHLVDAARSLKVGSAWEFENRLGPLIRPPQGDLKRALTTLEKGESWALVPQNLNNHPSLWTPGIKWDVQPESITHLTEFFGPLLAVMRAENLAEAIDLANHTGYGLTSGLESLDRREIETWKAEILAGNLYINRPTTGAITLRQPFGGWGKSALGPGIKAGSPNTVAQFMDFCDTAFAPVERLVYDDPLLQLMNHWQRKLDSGQFGDLGPDIAKTIHAVKSYLLHAQVEFYCENDYFHLRGQDNILRYRPVGRIVVRLHPEDCLFETLARIAAGRIARCPIVVSIPPGVDNRLTDFLASADGRQFMGPAQLMRQTDRDLIRMMPFIARIRYATADRVPAEVLAAAAKRGFYVARAPVLMEGSIELLHYFQNQSVCHNYHRYGNLGARTLEGAWA
jgi:RHH-type proline utilization regulon transcriptional repressor/proline dehydrogenase/delta 1-pyrroline-5-carboxylate dehydrogenase